jgi:hypothetical protein
MHGDGRCAKKADQRLFRVAMLSFDVMAGQTTQVSMMIAGRLVHVLSVTGKGWNIRWHQQPHRHSALSRVLQARGWAYPTGPP